VLVELSLHVKNLVPEYNSPVAVNHVL